MIDLHENYEFSYTVAKIIKTMADIGNKSYNILFIYVNSIYLSFKFNNFDHGFFF